MIPERRYVLRFRAHQAAPARQLRASAEGLRSRVSVGVYGDSELKQFWALCEKAGLVLHVSNTELAERAGLGNSFFLSVARDRRRPKLANFLRALTAIIDLADERLVDVDRTSENSKGASESNSNVSTQRLEQEWVELLLLAKSLSQLASTEIEKLDSERPNDPIVLERNKKQRELLVIFADGFEKIASALESFSANANKTSSLGQTKKIVTSVGNQVSTWWINNGYEVIDWSVRIPVFAAGVGLLGLVGASMPVATTAIAAMVGGNKVVAAIRSRKKSKQSHS